MVTISEISEGGVGSLGGLNQLPALNQRFRPELQQGVKLGPDTQLVANAHPAGWVPAPMPDVLPNQDSGGSAGGSDQGPYGTGQNPGAMTQGGSFLDNLINAVKANPMMFAVGATALVAAMFFVPRLIAGFHAGAAKQLPVEPLGLGGVRKPRKKTKGGKKFYVHFGGDGGPMSTVSFKSKAAAQKAVREAKAAGEPARMQGA